MQIANKNTKVSTENKISPNDRALKIINLSRV